MTDNDKRERIIKAAYKVLVEQGYEKASTKEIAREAGVAQGLINYYFASKDELFIAVLRHDLCEYCVRLQQMYSDSSPVPELDMTVLHHILGELRHETAAHPEAYMIRNELFSAGLRKPAVRAEIAAYMAESRKEISTMVERITGLPEAQCAPFAAVMFSMMDGLAMQKHIDPDFDLDAPFHTLALMIAGWLKQSGQ